MYFYVEDSHCWKLSSCLLFGPEEKPPLKASLERLADVRFQAVVTPNGQEGLSLFFKKATAMRWQLRGGTTVRNPWCL